MGRSLAIKIMVVMLLAIWGIVYDLPNFVNIKEDSVLPSQTVNYGLDIQGGLHLVMGVDIEEVIAENTRRLATTLKDYFKDKNISITDVTTEKRNDKHYLIVKLQDSGDLEKTVKSLESDYVNLQVINDEGDTIELRYYDSYVTDFKKKTVSQAIETIRNRIDEFGVAEPSITAQGEDRILIQLPGIEDASKAKELINKTAQLQFKIAANDVNMAEISQKIKEAEEKGNYSLATVKYTEYIKRINEDLKDALPENTRLRFAKAENAKTITAGSVPYVLEWDVNLGGDDLKGAQVSFGEFGDPQVALNFNSTGGKKFADITGNNVNRQMAIVLDDVVYTAPNINERIGGGSAVITLGRSNYEAQLAEANLISMALRAGALPAKLEQLEERTVGPTLGHDSIEKAKKAIMVGGILVLLFMLVWYKAFGVIANIALILNGILILAVLTSLNATLTLPGVAGIALTIGMAVDANVIIFERIKEELRKGMSLKAAVKEGYARALSAILDANITTAATSVILMYFGTGPVRGFAVTLLIGIITSLITAIFVTQTLVDVLLVKFKVKKLAI